MTTNTTFTGNDYVCSYCGSAFTGTNCPNCGSTEYKKSKERLEWEEEQRKLAQAAIDLEEHKLETNASIVKHNSKAKLITIIIFVSMFLFAWISHMLFMSSSTKLF